MPITNTVYIKDEGRCSGPVMFPGETYSFYINADEPISDPGFATFRLDIMDEQKGITVLEGIGELEKDVIADPFYNIMCSFVCPDLPFGWYRLVIRDTADATEGAIRAVSNLINIEEPGVVKNTTLIAYRNSENKYNFRYEENPDFFNRIRIPLIQTGYKIENDRRQYRNVSDRRLRNITNYKDFLVTLETYLLDEGGHVAMSAIYDHDTIYVNNHFVIPKENYQIGDLQNSVLTKGTIDVYVDYLEQPPAGAQVEEVYLVDHTIDEILAQGNYILIR